MQARLTNGWRRAALGLDAVLAAAGCWLAPRQRPLVTEMWRLSRSFPDRYTGSPLPDFLASLTPNRADLAPMDSEQLRRLVDAVARLDRRSPFGLCLRRSLLRYYYLRRAGVPLGINFAVRFRQPLEGKGVAGHAWNTLDGQPWHELEEDYCGFTVIYEWRG